MYISIDDNSILKDPIIVSGDILIVQARGVLSPANFDELRKSMIEQSGGKLKIVIIPTCFEFKGVAGGGRVNE